MITLDNHLADYVALRRRMGFVVRNDTFALKGFVRFCNAAGTDTVTTDLVVDWVMAPQDVGRAWLAKRFSLARNFAIYLHGIDQSHQVPPARMVTGGDLRRNPYLYTDHDIGALLDATIHLRGQLRPTMFRTLIGLLAVTGLRISEAIALNDDTVSVDDGHLTIRNTKFNKSRLVPVHPTTVSALRRYVEERTAVLMRQTSDAGFFVTDTGNRIVYRQVHQTFTRCLRLASIGADHRTPATMHDLRHTFAVNTLIGWYRDADVDVAAMLPYLSTYLGHVDPKSTYWYLTASPELASVVAGHLDNMFEVTS